MKDKDYVALSQAWFDEQAADYDENTSLMYSRNGKISCQRIRELLAGRQYDTLLDVGCGTGYLIELLRQDNQAQLIGLDLSPAMIEQAKKKRIPHSKWLVGRSDKLPVADESVDVVTCSQSFHHYPETESALREVYRVLRPGGIYVLSDTGVGPFRRVGVVISNWIYRHWSSSGDCNVSYREYMEHELKRLGMKIVDSEQNTFFIYTIVAQKPKKM